MAVLDVDKLVKKSGIRIPKGFDARQFLIDADAHIEHWEWGNDPDEQEPITTLSIPNNGIGRAQQALGNFVLSLTDDDVCDACPGCSTHTDPTVVKPSDSLGWTIYEITERRIEDQREGVRLLSILEGGCRWFADKERRCWEVAFNSWPNIIGPHDFQQCRLFNFRRHSTGRDARTCWGEPCDRPAIFVGTGDVPTQLDAWRAALVWTVIESGYRLVCEGFRNGHSASVVTDEWRDKAFAKFMESPNAETARAAAAFLTLPPLFDGLDELKVATGMAGIGPALLVVKPKLLTATRSKKNASRKTGLKIERSSRPRLTDEDGRELTDTEIEKIQVLWKKNEGQHGITDVLKKRFNLSDVVVAILTARFRQQQSRIKRARNK